MIAELLKKVRKNRLFRTAAPPVPPAPLQPRKVSVPSEPIAFPPAAPKPPTEVPVTPVAVDSMQSAADDAIRQKMVRYLTDNYKSAIKVDPNADIGDIAAELQENIPVPTWLTTHSHLWDQALSEWQKSLGSLELLPEESNVAETAELTNEQLNQIAQGYTSIPAFEDLPPEIAGNESNINRFYDILDNMGASYDCRTARAFTRAQWASILRKVS